MIKKTPSVIFEQMPLKLETEMISDFLNSNWSQKITNAYPEFISIKNERDIKQQAKLISEIITKIREKSETKLNNSLLKIKDNWQKIENRCFETLSEIINTDWPDREITAFISINPICPRFLDTWSFSVSPLNKDPNIIIAHEISHFLFFKKFSELYKNIPKSNYNFPNKEWLLSEFAAVVTLNDKRMQKILNNKENFYKEHLLLKIDERLVTDVIQNLYDEFVVKQNNYEKFIEEGLKIVKK